MLFSDNLVKLSLGDLSDMGTPGPIPNPEVKHISADGTWRATSRESRSLPRGFSFKLETAQAVFCLSMPALKSSDETAMFFVENRCKTKRFFY